MKTLRIINKSKYQAEKKKTPHPPKKTPPKPNDNNQKKSMKENFCIRHHPWGIQMHVKTDLKNYQL